LATDYRIIPFRGEFFALAPEKRNLIQRHIYPIPDPALPFVGIHLTRMIDGGISVGPNAVLALAREGYDKPAFSLRDCSETLAFPGFWRMSAKYWRAGLQELGSSWVRRAYLQRVRQYCPALSLGDLRPHPAGIRAQAVRADGSFVHDFLFAGGARTLHVCNAPSPAATSAIPIGRHLVSLVQDKLRL
jgi:L-2-hydroxyglutarate oxidase